MNGRNRHIQYRRSVYRRRSIKTVLLVVGIVLAVVFVAFLVFGNLLHRRSERLPVETDEPRDTQGVAEELPSLPSIQAHPILLETAESGNFASRIDALANAGISAASIPLNRADGTLLYASPVAISLNLQSAGDRSVKLADAIASVRSTNVYLSGTFHLTAFAERDDLVRSVRLSEERAILAEALRAGLDDLLLVVPALPDEQAAELSLFLSELRVLAPDTYVGLALTSEALSAENAERRVSELAAEFDFLALDATASESALGDLINAHRYELLRYHMRILLPAVSDAEALERVISTVKDNGIYNYQILG